MPAGVVIEVDVQGGVAKWSECTIKHPAIALRSSGVKRRSTTRPCPGMTASPLPVWLQPCGHREIIAAHIAPIQRCWYGDDGNVRS